MIIIITFPSINDKLIYGKGVIKINSKHNKETKQIVVKAYHEGVCVSEIVKQFDIPRSTVYSWIKAHLQSENDQKESRLGDYHKLKEKIKKQEIMIEILQRAYGASELPVRQKLYFAESIYSEYSVHAICDALLLSRGTFYNHLKRNKRYNAWYEKRKDYLRQKILEVYHNNNQIYGAEKITVVLKNKGEKVSVKMVRMLMKDMGLSSIRQEAKDMYDKEKQKHKNYLNQKFHVEKPNEVWVSDITFITINKKGYYICVIIDLFARRVVGYRIGYNNSTQLTKSTFKNAYEARRPDDGLIFHTDNGTNYRSKRFVMYLKSLNVTQSFSRAYVPYDNSVMESFFSNLKREELYRKKYCSEKEFRTAVDSYIKFYNLERPHAANKYKTPAQKEAEYYSKQAKNSDI